MHQKFMEEAIKEAEISSKEGGLPIGAVLVKENQIISRGHNRLIQKDSSILHAEMDAIENAGRLNHEDYQKCTLYTTLSPCPMCSGAVILYNIPRVVIGDNQTLMGAEKLLKDNGVEIIVLNDDKCKELFEDFVNNNPGIWENELAKVGNTTELKE
ncbi:CMP/dCMP deaminase [Methanobrevibacter ruminantium M1]|uniref:CMP/dCMP deaminase n=1 Tax=Methanobrevibacter ruminantium (strain ATCC 35063 / DSM 1093 / JCM 13430 / OCM 146 / M1) TaxID=634498 RepID=D3E1G4_METRM|nr:nucleoside deaminase [Methanobrevibacter ruminantium]ADC48049.1 CMP/dCMP deaminase [Methanobrevibacter ruminantium M1]